MQNTIPFAQRMRPAIKAGGFRLDDYWVWCGSAARGEDGRFHLFASRWPKKYPFFHGYLAASEVVRASSDVPEGPYRFEEVVLPARGAGFWDGRMTHNPFIVPYGDEWLLFYIGSTYEGATPTPETMHEMRAQRVQGGRNGQIFGWYRDIRIGMARSKSVFGPWQRPDAPTFNINPGGWDSNVVTNPAPCVSHAGELMLYYRSGPARLGLAVAQTPDQPFQRVLPRPIVDLGAGLEIEDPCVFRSGSGYEMICKDLTGGVTGEFHAGVHLLSPDGLDWRLAPQPKAWSRTIHWDDGTLTKQASIERPFILLEQERPAYLFAATADGPGPHDGRAGHYFARNTWNISIPLRP